MTRSRFLGFIFTALVGQIPLTVLNKTSTVALALDDGGFVNVRLSSQAPTTQESSHVENSSALASYRPSTSPLPSPSSSTPEASTSPDLPIGVLTATESPSRSIVSSSASIPSTFPRPSTLPTSFNEFSANTTAPVPITSPSSSRLGNTNEHKAHGEPRKGHKDSHKKKEENVFPAQQQSHRRSGITVMRSGSAAQILMQAPPSQLCRLGQRFVVNHILFICHQFDPHRRGFRPFACTVKNDPASLLVARDGVHDDKQFRYKCHGDEKSLSYQAVVCLLNEIHIQPGKSLRKGRMEYTCLRDDRDGMLKMVETSFLHDYCSPGRSNDSLVSADSCPGTSTGVHHAHFGNGTEVVFDTKRRILIA